MGINGNGNNVNNNLAPYSSSGQKMTYPQALGYQIAGSSPSNIGINNQIINNNMNPIIQPQSEARVSTYSPYFPVNQQRAN